MADEIPTAPREDFQDFLRKTEQIEGERLAAAIPREHFEPRVARGLAGFVLSWALYLGAIVGVYFAPLWLDIPLWIVAGLGGWGLQCIGHDCGHGSFSRSRRLNVVIGSVSLLPLVYPFHAWRHVHNMHHTHTNHMEFDTDWRPLPQRVYQQMPLSHKIFYHSIRTWAFWGGSISQWWRSGFRPGFFPKRQMRRDVRNSIVFTLAASALYFPALVYFTGLEGLLFCFAIPWLVSHVWFSGTTLMHHSASDVPFLWPEHWTKNASRLLVTTDYVYPRWLSLLTHNISIHTAHHVSPAVPYYNLPKAQQALKEAYPGLVREHRFSFRHTWRILRRLHFYDVEAGFYADFAGNQVVPQAPAPKTGER